LRQRLEDGNWQYDQDAGTLMKYDNIRGDVLKIVARGHRAVVAA
jgi:hypothetical protein